MNLHEYYRHAGDGVLDRALSEGVVGNALSGASGLVQRATRAVGDTSIAQSVKSPDYWKAVGGDLKQAAKTKAKEVVGDFAGFATSAVGFGGVGKTVFDTAAKNLKLGVSGQSPSAKLVEPLLVAVQTVASNASVPTDPDDRASFLRGLTDQLDKGPAAFRQFALNYGEKAVTLLELCAFLYTTKPDKTVNTLSYQADASGSTWALDEVAPFLGDYVVGNVVLNAMGYPDFPSSSRKLDDYKNFLKPMLDDARTAALVFRGTRSLNVAGAPSVKEVLRLNPAARSLVQFFYDSGLL